MRGFIETKNGVRIAHFERGELSAAVTPRVNAGFLVGLFGEAEQFEILPTRRAAVERVATWLGVK